jgi:hypothetical protein
MSDSGHLPPPLSRSDGLPSPGGQRRVHVIAPVRGARPPTGGLLLIIVTAVGASIGPPATPESPAAE